MGIAEANRVSGRGPRPTAPREASPGRCAAALPDEHFSTSGKKPLLRPVDTTVSPSPAIQMLLEGYDALISNGWTSADARSCLRDRLSEAEVDEFERTFFRRKEDTPHGAAAAPQKETPALVRPGDRKVPPSWRPQRMQTCR